MKAIPCDIQKQILHKAGEALKHISNNSLHSDKLGLINEIYTKDMKKEHNVMIRIPTSNVWHQVK